MTSVHSSTLIDPRDYTEDEFADLEYKVIGRASVELLGRPKAPDGFLQYDLLMSWQEYLAARRTFPDEPEVAGSATDFALPPQRVQSLA